MTSSTQGGWKLDGDFLVKSWNAPLDTRLMKKQFSIRMPILVMAKVNALSDVFPMMSKTGIIGGLLSLALSQVEENLPTERGTEEKEHPVTDEPCFRMGGMRGRYEALTEKYLREFEKDAGYESEPLEFNYSYRPGPFWDDLKKREEVR